MRRRLLPTHPGVQAATCVMLAVLVGLTTNILTSYWNWALGLALGVTALVWASLEWIRSISNPQSARGYAGRISVNQKIGLLHSGRLVGARGPAADADVEVVQKVGRAEEKLDIIGVDADAAPGA